MFGQRFLPGEPQGTWGCFPSEQEISWGKEKASSQDPLTSPGWGWGETQPYKLIPLPASASPKDTLCPREPALRTPVCSAEY